MSAALSYGLNTLLIFFESAIFLICVSAFFHPRKGRGRIILFYPVIAASQCLTVAVSANVPLLKFVALLALMTAWSVFCFDTTIPGSLFPVILCEAYLSLSDIAVQSLLALLFGEAAQTIFSTPESFYFVSFISKIIELFGALIICFWAKRHYSGDQMSTLEWSRVIIFPASIMVVSAYLIRIVCKAPELSGELLFCSIILLLLDLVSILIVNYLDQQQSAIKENLILRQNMKRELESLSAWQEAYREQRKQTHDFHNHLLAVEGMLQSLPGSEEALEYIHQLQKTEDTGSSFMHTRRSAVEAILQQKRLLADSKKILISYQLDDLKSFPLPDDEFIVVLSNLIDNAIEACEQIPEAPERQIRLKIRNEEGAAYLYIENKTAAPVFIQNGRIPTSKNNPDEHGYGMINVLSILNRYQTISSINYDETTGIFSFSAQIAKE